MTREGGTVLEALGVNLDAAPAVVAGCVHQLGFGFCFAPRFHPAMKAVAPIRKALGRSPDRGDALCLAVWEVRGVEDERPALAAEAPTETASAVYVDEAPVASADPYAGLGAWGRS